jgi:hypothetical protein
MIGQKKSVTDVLSDEVAPELLLDDGGGAFSTMSSLELL